MNTVNYLSHVQIIETLVKHESKFAVIVYNNLQYDTKEECELWGEVVKGIKLLFDEEEANRYLSYLVHGGLFLFDNEDLCKQFNNIFVAKMHTQVFHPSGYCIQ